MEEDKDVQTSDDGKVVNDLTAPDDEWDMRGAPTGGNKEEENPVVTVLKFLGKILLWFIAIVLLWLLALFIACLADSVFH